MGNSPSKNSSKTKKDQSKINNSKNISKANYKSDSEYEYYEEEVLVDEDDQIIPQNNVKNQSHISNQYPRKIADTNKEVIFEQVESENYSVNMSAATYEKNDIKNRVFDKYDYMQKIESKKLEISDALKFAINYNEFISNSDLTLCLLNEGVWLNGLDNEDEDNCVANAQNSQNNFQHIGAHQGFEVNNAGHEEDHKFLHNKHTDETHSIPAHEKAEECYEQLQNTYQDSPAKKNQIIKPESKIKPKSRAHQLTESYFNKNSSYNSSIKENEYDFRNLPKLSPDSNIKQSPKVHFNKDLSKEESTDNRLTMFSAENDGETNFGSQTLENNPNFNDYKTDTENYLIKNENSLKVDEKRSSHFSLEPITIGKQQFNTTQRIQDQLINKYFSNNRENTTKFGNNFRNLTNNQYNHQNKISHDTSNENLRVSPQKNAHGLSYKSTGSYKDNIENRYHTDSKKISHQNHTKMESQIIARMKEKLDDNLTNPIPILIQDRDNSVVLDTYNIKNYKNSQVDYDGNEIPQKLVKFVKKDVRNLSKISNNEMLAHYNYTKDSDVVYQTYNNNILNKAKNNKNFEPKSNFDTYKRINLEQKGIDRKPLKKQTYSQRDYKKSKYPGADKRSLLPRVPDPIISRNLEKSEKRRLRKNVDELKKIMDFSKKGNSLRNPFSDESYLMNVTTTTNNNLSNNKQNFIGESNNKKVNTNDITTDLKDENTFSHKKTVNVKDTNTLRKLIDSSFVN